MNNDNADSALPAKRSRISARWIIGAIATYAIVQIAANRFLAPPVVAMPADMRLARASEEFNRRLPIFIDNVTRLDETIATHGRFMYLFTVVGMDKSAFDRAAAEMKGHLITAYKTSEQMKLLRESGVAITAMYRSEDGSVLGKIIITSKELKD